ncbi:AraC family transcriptional regulator [Nitratireductor indicus C115]|uniref:AraC family transcriptional regulator n=1 Tax=Nitratireductor indicus C115 TaxID=1231190 RepID=K2NMB6_9HYPH|nr:AraC family transcriptional regulator [Nitratireductor indicus]EKF40560.1 AraC family transcriptional regulator [Nitratireductor indicus C115]SFQ49170.1 AraC-type DNA-binding protein [Nitratireductor indicus]
MIENSSLPQKHDRLTAFLKAFPLSATHCDVAEAANLVILDADGRGRPSHLIYRARSTCSLPDGASLFAAARVEFGGSANPLVGALPDELSFQLADEPQILGLSDLIVAEVEVTRCGRGTVQARLCEIVIVLAIRKAIARGTVDAGLLAGLAHPRLHASLVAMHDDPARNWQIADLAAVAEMSRGQFIAAFKRTVGLPPAAYLNGWRLALGRAELRSGYSVKSVAAKVGFGSAAAFSRAFSRRFGCPPVHTRTQGAVP